jgi:glycogen operon protein
VEGETDSETINTLRTRQLKNFLATLMLSQGVPMLLGGDEFRRTQRGNNNAYCQDNELSWYDWNFVKKHKEMVRFTKELIAFRKRHPALRRTHFFSGQDTDHDGMPDISWYTAAAHELDWSVESTSLACLIDGSYPETSGEVTDNDLYLMFNASLTARKFVLPKLPSGKKWWRALDTALTAPRDIVPKGKEPPVKPNRPYRVGPRSVVVLISKP